MKPRKEDVYTIGHQGDWCAIFKNDELLYWHDTPHPGMVLSMAGHEVEYVELDMEIGGGEMPCSLASLKEKLAANRRAEIEAQKAKLQAQIDDLNQQLQAT